MGNAQLLLATTLLAVAACSGGNSHAPLVAIGAGGSVADASAGGSENGGFGAGQNTGGGSAQNTGGGSAQNTGGGSAQNTGGGSAQNTGGGSAQNTGGGSAQNTGGGSAQNTGGSSGLGSGGTSGTGSGGGGVIGGGGSGADAGAVPECTLSSGVEGCDSCVQRHCNSECVTCQTDSECNAIIECVLTSCFNDQGVINQTCAGQCETAHPNGTPDFNNFIVNQNACARVYCESFCNFF